MKTFILSIIMLFIMNNVYAADFSVKAGTDISYFRGEDCDLRPGYTIGADISWPLFGSERLFWSMGGYFVQKQFVLKNKTWGREYVDGYEEYEIYFTTLHISTQFIKVPIKFSIGLDKNEYPNFRLFLGASAAVSVSDNSKKNTKKRIIISEKELDQNSPDYWYIRFGDTKMSSVFAAISGAEIVFEKLGIGIQYNRAFLKSKTAFFINIEHPLDTIQIFINYFF